MMPIVTTTFTKWQPTVVKKEITEIAQVGSFLGPLAFRLAVLRILRSCGALESLSVSCVEENLCQSGSTLG